LNDRCRNLDPDERNALRTTNAYARTARAILVGVGLTGAVGCEQVEQIQDHFRDMTPYEAYQASLERAGLAETALAAAWSEAGAQAVNAPLDVSLPFQEQGYIAPEEPGAMGYRVTIPRGRRLTAEVTLETREGTRVFVDLFRLASDDEDPARPLISTDSVPGTFIHEPWRGGDFVLRLQPELLRGGQYTVTLRLEAQLAFPVEGHGVRAIQSRFGVARDGGRREHHGVDIFAPRGTPVLASSAGVVNRVQDTSIGGKVVWVRDPLRNANLYYAHLDSQAVSAGQEVFPGDTLGFVGNTGNARTTPPHLHFGLYRRGEGPVDPFPFLDPPPTALPALTADVGRLGTWVRIQTDGIRLRTAPSLRSDVLGELEQYTPLRVLGGSGEYYRVRLPDGSQGYVAARLTESVDQPVAEELALGTRTVRVHPSGDAPVMATFPAGSEIPVLGRYEGYLYVRAPSGHGGWVGAESEE
jgi:peptidoglycan LD-endopeptidase LytH